MKRLSLLLLFVVVLSLKPAFATANHTYKKDEYDVVEQGRSPDKRWSIATHGDGELGYDNFHVYLMSGLRHKKIGPLEEIDQILDTAASAYNAVWSPDSRHVAIFYRVDRHLRTMMLYRIENDRAYLVSGSSLLKAINKQKSANSPELRSGYISLQWQTSTRFKLTEGKTFRGEAGDFGKSLAHFARTEEEVVTDPPLTVYTTEFSAEAACILIPGDRYRVVLIKPGKFDP